MKNKLFYKFKKIVTDNPLIKRIVDQINKEEGLELTEMDIPELTAIVYMFDKKSQIRLQQPSYETRWKAAAELAGYYSDLNKLVSLKNPSYVRFLALILQYQDSKVFSILQTYELLFNEFTLNLIKPLEDQGKDLLQATQMKTKIREELRVLVTEIRSLENELYGDEINTQGVEEFTNYSTPEAYIKTR